MVPGVYHGPGGCTVALQMRTVAPVWRSLPGTKQLYLLSCILLVIFKRWSHSQWRKSIANMRGISDSAVVA